MLRVGVGTTRRAADARNRRAEEHPDVGTSPIASVPGPPGSPRPGPRSTNAARIEGQVGPSKSHARSRQVSSRTSRVHPTCTRPVRCASMIPRPAAGTHDLVSSVGRTARRRRGSIPTSRCARSPTRRVDVVASGEQRPEERDLGHRDDGRPREHRRSTRMDHRRAWAPRRRPAPVRRSALRGQPTQASDRISPVLGAEALHLRGAADQAWRYRAHSWLPSAPSAVGRLGPRHR